MTAQITRWFEYREPTGNARVEAVIRTTYQTGPSERPRDDDVQHGTVEYDALDVMEQNEEVQHHTHDDGSVMLSGLSEETEDELLETFKPIDMAEQIRRWVNQGLSAATALDYYMVEREGWSQSAWAKQRGVSQQAVSDNVGKAMKKLED